MSDISRMMNLLIKAGANIRFAAAVFLIVVMLTFNVRADDDSSFLGMQLPYVIGIVPDTMPDLLIRNAVFDRGGLRSAVWLKADDTLPQVNYPTRVPLVFYLSPAGSVDSVVELENHGKDFLKGIKKSLQSISFKPAQYNGQSAAFALRGDLLIRPMRKDIWGTLFLPYDPRSGYHNSDLIEQSMIRNGFIPPAIVRFPSYFCPFKLGESSGLTPFITYEVYLDTLGDPTEISEYCRSFIGFSDPIFRGLLHAKFSAAKYGGQALASRIYVTVRFFDKIKYPTGEWPPATDDSTAVFPYDFCRVSYSMYPDSILTPPVPQNIHDGTFFFEPYFAFNDTVRVFVRVDTKGRVSTGIPAYLPFKAMQSLLDSALKALIFEPARDKWDRPVPFDGELLMKGDFSETIRIDVLWLPSEAQRGIRLSH